MAEIALVGVFAGLPDRRRKQGRRHSLPLCLALFTLAVAAGNQGFLAIGDWLKSYKQQLKELFEVDILPSYSTIRRALLFLDYKDYSVRLAQFFEIEPISDLTASALEFGQRIRGSWGVENKVHYVRDVTQGEDKSRIRTKPLPQIMAIARNLALNLYRDAGFNNMAQAERKCQYGLDLILNIFRMK